MLRLTRGLVASVFGAGRGDMAVLGLPLIPAAAVADVAVAAVSRLRQAVAVVRVGLAERLRAVAECLDPVPVATADDRPSRAAIWCDGYDTGRAHGEAAAAVADVPPTVLVMASAAQVTAEEAVPESAPELPPKPTAGHTELTEALLLHGSVRGAARALGIAESTFRSRCKKLGVQTPSRKAKG
jgi:hypothetical protein